MYIKLVWWAAGVSVPCICLTVVDWSSQLPVFQIGRFQLVVICLQPAASLSLSLSLPLSFSLSLLHTRRHACALALVPRITPRPAFDAILIVCRVLANLKLKRWADALSNCDAALALVSLVQSPLLSPSFPPSSFSIFTFRSSLPISPTLSLFPSFSTFFKKRLSAYLLGW